MIILESDVLIELLDKNSPRKNILLKALEENAEELATTSLNLEEVLYGVLKRSKMRQIPAEHPLNSFPVISFTREDAIIAAKLEVELERKGMKKPRGDVLIAAVTIRMKARLFTINLKHFEGMERLELFSLDSNTT